MGAFYLRRGRAVSFSLLAPTGAAAPGRRSICKANR